MTTQSVTFQVDDYLLSGVFHFPQGKNNYKRPAIIFVHGFVGSKVGEHRLFVKAARYFSSRGYIVFRFDFSGCGESDGDYQDVTLTKQIKELQHAIHYVAQAPYVDRENITVIGHSLGGAVSSLTVPLQDDIQKLVLWSPVAKPYENIKAITGENAVQESFTNGIYDYQGFHLSSRFFQDLKKHDPLQAIQKFNGYFLLIHADEDEDVPKENGWLYYHSVNQRKTIHFIKESDHTFSSYSFENELFAATYAWLQQFEKFTSYQNIV